MISRHSSMSFSSRLTILTGGIRRPSWKTSVASAAKLPTAFPPISARWPTFATKPNSSPSWKTGRITECSGRCAPPRYGSLCSTTSPGSKESTPSSSTVQRTMNRLAAELGRAELGLPDHVAVAVEQHAREVEALVEDRREGGAHHRDAHLAADVHEAVVDDRERDRVDGHAHASSSSHELQHARRRGRRAATAGARRSSSPSTPRRAARRVVPAATRLAAQDRRRHEPVLGKPDLAARRPRPRVAAGAPARRAGSGLAERDHAEPHELDRDRLQPVAVVPLVERVVALEDRARARASARRPAPRPPARSSGPGSASRSSGAPRAAHPPHPGPRSRARPSLERAEQAAELRAGVRSAIGKTLLTASTRSGAASVPNAEQTPGLGGTSTRRMPMASAISAACVGPAPPKATSTNSRGSMPCSTVTMRMAFAMFSFAIRTIDEATSTPSGPARSPSRSSAPPRALGVQRQPPAEEVAGIEAAERDVGVRDGRLLAARP